MSIQPNSPARSSYSYYNVLNDVSNRVKGEKTRECASVLEQNTKPKSSDFTKVVDRIPQRNQRELSSWQQQNKKVPLSQAYNLRRSPPNTPVIAKVVSSIIPIRSTQEIDSEIALAKVVSSIIPIRSTQEIDSEIALAKEMQQRTRQTTASAPQTQSTTRAAARALRREKQASQQAEKEKVEATLKKEALDKAWSDLSAFDGFETEKDSVKRMPSDETARINTSPWKDFRKKDHLETLFEKIEKARREDQKKHINSLTVDKIKELVVDKLKNFIPSESEIDFLHYAIEKLENNEDHIANPHNWLSEFFEIISPEYVDEHISDLHSDKSVQSRMRDLKATVKKHYYSLHGYIGLINNPSLLLKLIFMEEGIQKTEESSKRLVRIFLRNLESLDSEKVISLNNKIQKKQKKYNNTLSFYSREIIRIINQKAENIIDKTKLAEKHITPETTSQSQKKRIQPQRIQPIRIEPTAVLEKDFSSKTPEELADEIVRIFRKYETGTMVIGPEDKVLLNYSVGEDDSLGVLIDPEKNPKISHLLNRIISNCHFMRSGHPCANFMEKIKTAKEKIENERRAQKAIIDKAQRVVARERAKNKKEQKEQAKIEKAKQKEDGKQARIAAARTRRQAKAEEAEKNKVTKMMSSWDWGQPKVGELETSFPEQELEVEFEKLPETQIITLEESERNSAIGWLSSSRKALHAAQEKLQAHVEYPEKLDLFRKFFWMLCSATTWNDKKDELTSDVRHLSEQILSVITAENLKKIASRVNGDGFYVINVEDIFKVSLPQENVKNNEIWVDQEFVEEALKKISK